MLIRPAETRDARSIARGTGAWLADRLSRHRAGRVSRTSHDGGAHESMAGNLAELKRWRRSSPKTIARPSSAGRATAPNRSDLGAEVGELAGLYVDPNHWNRGVGAALLAEAEHRPLPRRFPARHPVDTRRKTRPPGASMRTGAGVSTARLRLTNQAPKWCDTQGACGSR